MYREYISFTFGRWPLQTTECVSVHGSMSKTVKMRIKIFTRNENENVNQNLKFFHDDSIHVTWTQRCKPALGMKNSTNCCSLRISFVFIRKKLQTNGFVSVHRSISKTVSVMTMILTENQDDIVNSNTKFFCNDTIPTKNS